MDGCGAGTAGGTGHVIEFAGSVFRELSVEARMSVGLRRSCPGPLPPARPSSPLRLRSRLHSQWPVGSGVQHGNRGGCARWHGRSR